MELYKKRFAETLAETGALFFKENLTLKDGRPTPYFVNMAMFRTGKLSMILGEFYAAMMVEKNIVPYTDIILGPSYKGSAIALSTAIALWKNYNIDLPFEYDRKEIKSHGEGSQGGSLFVNNTFFDGSRLFIVDDVATSMSTKYELMDKIQSESKKIKKEVTVKGIGIGIDRQQTTAVYDQHGIVIENQKGEDTISAFTNKYKIPIYSIAGIKEVIDYLYNEKVPILIDGKMQPINKKTMTTFKNYIATYGV